MLLLIVGAFAVVVAVSVGSFFVSIRRLVEKLADKLESVHVTFNKVDRPKQSTEAEFHDQPAGLLPEASGVGANENKSRKKLKH